MSIKSDLVTAQALLNANDKAQVQATRDAAQALVDGAKSALANLPDPSGPVSKVRDFIDKASKNAQALVTEADFILALYVDQPAQG